MSDLAKELATVAKSRRSERPLLSLSLARFIFLSLLDQLSAQSAKNVKLRKNRVILVKQQKDRAGFSRGVTCNDESKENVRKIKAKKNI